MAKIVVLDNVFQHGELLGTRLKSDGHDVRAVSASADAIDLAHLFQPDLLITDWDLEGDDYDGIEVVEAFYAAIAEIKTIVLSARDSAKNEYRRLAESDRGKLLGLIASFQKPVSNERLAMTVSYAMQTSLV